MRRTCLDDDRGHEMEAVTTRRYADGRRVLELRCLDCGAQEVAVVAGGGTAATYRGTAPRVLAGRLARLGRAVA